MRGRQATPLTISAADRPILEAVARCRRLSWFQVQHARIVLAVAAGEPAHDVAARLECHRATVWRICRRYEQGGLSKLLLDDPRVGRPQEISPPAARPDRRTRLPGARRRGAGDHALDQRGLGPSGGGRRHRASHQPRHGPPHLAAGGPAAAPHALLAHGAAGRALQGAGRESALVLRECGAIGPPRRLGRLHRRGPQPPGAERDPIRRAIPGHIEQQEFEYTRHGTVNLLLFLVVHTGEMGLTVLEANDAAHYIPALRDFRARHRGLKGAFLIHDGGASHIAQATADYLKGCAGWWRPRLTPAHASWLNQAEMLVRAFGGRYLRRGSWTTREGFLEHVLASWPEYNQRYAHPFDWTWTNDRMRKWFAEHAQ